MSNKYTISAGDRLSREEIKEKLRNSSGLILEEDEGLLTLGYVDFDVSEFGGRDYECFYKLDLRNSELLKSVLQANYQGDLFEQCVKAFTIKFSNGLFEEFCEVNNITYQKNTY